MGTRNRNNKKKTKILKIRDVIAENVGRQIQDPEFYCGENISADNQNKLSFIYFVNQRVNEFFMYDVVPSTQESIGDLNKLKNKLMVVNTYTGAYYGSAFSVPARKDFCDLEKSFRAYRYLCSAQEVVALEPNHYHLFKSVRNLQKDDEGYDEDIEPEEIVSFSENTEAMLQDGCEYLNMMHQKYDDQEDLRLINNGLILLREMQDQVRVLCGKRFLGDEDLNQKTVLAFGYAAFASKHLQEDEDIALENRYFLIEQTSRVLHYLCG